MSEADSEAQALTFSCLPASHASFCLHFTRQAIEAGILLPHGRSEKLELSQKLAIKSKNTALTFPWFSVYVLAIKSFCDLPLSHNVRELLWHAYLRERKT